MTKDILMKLAAIENAINQVGQQLKVEAEIGNLLPATEISTLLHTPAYLAFRLYAVADIINEIAIELKGHMENGKQSTN